VSEELDFREVYEEFQPKVLGYISRLVGHHNAEDTTQEVFEKLSRALDGFEGKSKLSTWLYRIATNTAIDKLRSPSFNRSSENLALDEGANVEDKNVWTGQTKNPPDQKLIREEMSECVSEYIEKRPPDYKTVIILSEIEGFKNREIADILQVSLDIVKIRLHRARAGLKKELDKGCDFYHNDQGILACDRKFTSITPKMPD